MHLGRSSSHRIMTGANTVAPRIGIADDFTLAKVRVTGNKFKLI